MTALLALLLIVLLPGLAGGVLLTSFASGPARPGAVLARSLSCGVAAWLLVSGILARTIGLSTGSSWAGVGFLALTSCVLLALPRCRAVLREIGGEVRYFAVILLVTAVSWLPMGLLVARSDRGPLGSTPWYYWDLAAQVARAGRVPDVATEWGTSLPFLGDYRLFSTGTAMLFTLDGAAAVRVLQLITLVSVVLLGCGAALLANALGAGRLASLAAVPLAVGTGVGAYKVISYRPEGFALGLMFLLVALHLDWLRHRDRTSLLAACLVAAVLSQVHGIALLTAGALIVASMVALWRPGVGAVPLLRRWGLGGLALAASTVLVALVMGSASGVEHAGGLSADSGVADPTWDFIRAISGLPPSVPPSSTDMAGEALGNVYRGTGWWVALGLVIATIALAACARRQAQARQLLVFTLTSLVVLGVAAAVFSFGYASYVPRRTGAHRLVQEATLLTGPYVAGALACVRYSELRVFLQQVAGGAAVVVLTVTGLIASTGVAGWASDLRPSPQLHQSLVGLRIPRDAVVLANAYTEGYLARTTRATGLLDGRAPYTYPDVLVRANTLLREARDFYAEPAAHLDFLEANDVSYVVVASSPGSLGMRNLLVRRVDRSKFEACERLERVIANPDIRVYRFRHDAAAPEGGLTCAG